ncbi:MAG: carbonic anhydrase [Acidimicrobiales bacterium]
MPSPTTAPTTTWSDLRAASDRASGPTATAIPEHRPRAAVLTCSDARVSPARLFDLPDGSLFVVRVAGNTATPEAVASLTYAVEELGTDTIVVLGHSHCGAVTAAVDDRVDPALSCLVDPIRAALDTAPDCTDLPCAVERNVAATVAVLRDDPGPLGAAIGAGRATVHGAVLDLATSALFDVPDPDPDNPDPDTLHQIPTSPTRSVTA